MRRDRDPVAQRFADDLNQLRQRAGQPSYNVLERLSGHRLKRATMSDILNGHRVKVPDWRFIHEFVTACRSAAEENRLDVDQLGTVADWKRHWDGAVSGIIGARFPGHGSQQSDAMAPTPEPREEARAMRQRHLTRDRRISERTSPGRRSGGGYRRGCLTSLGARAGWRHSAKP